MTITFKNIFEIIHAFRDDICLISDSSVGLVICVDDNLFWLACSNATYMFIIV